MRVVGVAVVALIFTIAKANAIANDALASIEAKGNDLVARLDELSISGKPLVHKEYREDTQTVTKNADGQYVVHVDSVFGEQDDDDTPTISKSQDEFVIPIEPEELVWDEDSLNQLWNEIWDPTNSYWNEWKSDDTVNKNDFAALPGDDGVIPEWNYAPYRDSVDRLLDDESAEVPAAVQDTFYDVKSQDEDWAALRYFYDVMDFDEDTLEWKLNPEKYEAKYGIKPYMDGDNVLDQQIDTLNQQINDEQINLDFDKEIKSDLVAEKELNQEIDALAEQIDDDKAVLDLEQDLESELVEEKMNIEDVVFIDPVTGNIKVDDEAYYSMFGTFPNFDYTPIQKEEEEQIEVFEPEPVEPQPDFISVEDAAVEPEDLIERNFDDIVSGTDALKSDWMKALRERFHMDTVMDDKYRSFTDYEPQMVPAVGAYP